MQMTIEELLSEVLISFEDGAIHGAILDAVPEDNRLCVSEWLDLINLRLATASLLVTGSIKVIGETSKVIEVVSPIYAATEKGMSECLGSS